MLPIISKELTQEAIDESQRLADELRALDKEWDTKISKDPEVKAYVDERNRIRRTPPPPMKIPILLHNFGIKKADIRSRLESLTGPFRGKLWEECQDDLKKINSLFKGQEVGRYVVTFDIKVPLPLVKLPPIDFDSPKVKELMKDEKTWESMATRRDKEMEQKFTTDERDRLVIEAKTNREAVWQIKEEILQLQKPREKLLSIPELLEEKRKTEARIAKVDVMKMKKEEFSREEWEQYEYILRYPEGPKELL